MEFRFWLIPFLEITHFASCFDIACLFPAKTVTLYPRALAFSISRWIQKGPRYRREKLALFALHRLFKHIHRQILCCSVLGSGTFITLQQTISYNFI
jgi:hypothetical protein